MIMPDLVERATRFRSVLDAAKKRVAPSSFEWYPYNSLSSAQHLETLLGDAHGYVMDSARDAGILDLGCGDGDMSFFFESQGYTVTGVDHPVNNHNGMQGLRALHRDLESKITIHEADADSEIRLDAKYGLTICLGVLYHLKNPFFALERLARISRYCILSTRIARRLPDGAPMPAKHALAYLLAEDELNGDDTNVWIFSEQGLRRILERTRWEVVELITAGDTVASDTSSLDHDERAFCLLKSHYGGQHLDLLEGWHQAEDSGWRWTEKQFAARATNHLGGRHSSIAMRLYAPPLLIEKFGSISLHAKIDGSEVQPFVMREAGIHNFLRKVPEPGEVTEVVFHLDHALGPDAEYSRELGVIVASLEFKLI
jgi:tRNA (mo5U34)-methyltransferase